MKRSTARRYDQRMPSNSPLAQALARVGDRWTLQIVAELLEGPARFGELAERIEGIAPNTLTQRLRHLEQEELLTTTPYSERPVRVVYELTEEGQGLASALRLLEAWGARRSGESDVDDAACPLCGSPVQTHADGMHEPDVRL
jgi:DNA-binding HxlR family transcriptional regulator